MQVRFGRRQSVGVDAQVTTKEATRNFEAEKEEQQQQPALEPTVSQSEDSLGGGEKKKTFAGVSRRKSITYEKEEFEKTSAEQQRRERNRRKVEESELIDDILEIPELGDDGAGDITMQVAAPPKEFKQHSMQSISQLDKDAQYYLPSETSIDLSMLTVSLSRADKVEEEDTLWTGETLLQELASTMDMFELDST